MLHVAERDLLAIAKFFCILLYLFDLTAGEPCMTFIAFCALLTISFCCTRSQGRIQGEHRGHMLPKPQVFFRNIILHRRVLFYKFADITAMFLLRYSLY